MYLYIYRPQKRVKGKTLLLFFLKVHTYTINRQNKVYVINLCYHRALPFIQTQWNHNGINM